MMVPDWMVKGLAGCPSLSPFHPPFHQRFSSFWTWRISLWLVSWPNPTRSRWGKVHLDQPSGLVRKKQEPLFRLATIPVSCFQETDTGRRSLHGPMYYFHKESTVM